jgi:hypothetical protein
MLFLEKKAELQSGHGPVRLHTTATWAREGMAEVTHLHIHEFRYTELLLWPFKKRTLVVVTQAQEAGRPAHGTRVVVFRVHKGYKGSYAALSINSIVVVSPRDKTLAADAAPLLLPVLPTCHHGAALSLQHSSAGCGPQ